MGPRRTAVLPVDADGWCTDADEVVFDLFADRRRDESDTQGPLTACLACGADPSVRGGCPHVEVARVLHAPPELHDAARRLRQATAERDELVRTLRRLMSVHQTRGEGEVTRTTSSSPISQTVPVFRDAVPVVQAVQPTRRRKSLNAAQGSLAFESAPGEKVSETAAAACPQPPFPPSK